MKKKITFLQRPAVQVTGPWVRIFLFTASLLIAVLHGAGQTDTAKLKREQQQQIEAMKAAQEKAIKQMEQMGIHIDPNKKMSREDAQKMKDQLMGQAARMKQQMGMDAQQTQAPRNVDISKIPDSKAVIRIAERFYKRSYGKLDVHQKLLVDKDLTQAAKDKFSVPAVKLLAKKGAALITLGTDHFIACVYITAAVKAAPNDTVAVNNFGAYLRIIDSTEASLPVLLYANSICPKAPLILTQIGCSLIELNDLIKAEKFLKEALKYNPDFGQAHTALCEVYIRSKRFKDALNELFAGVKNMGATYEQASGARMQIQNGFGPDGRDAMQDQTRQQMDPSEALAPLVPQDLARVEMPEFPECAKLEDWTEGGGMKSALDAYEAFHKFDQSFTKQFQAVLKEAPDLPPNAQLRDYPNERFAIECITDMFLNYSKNATKEYHKNLQGILDQISNVKEQYLRNFSNYQRDLMSCLQACPQGDTICPKECYRQYCARQCPNANQLNNYLQLYFGNYKTAFYDLVHRQKELLSDLYAFTDPWLAKISGPYWSRICAYEVRRTALAIIENTYMNYPQFIDPKVNDACGSDCSVYAVPFRAKPKEKNGEDPNGKDCPEDSKHSLMLFFCEGSITCEYWEIGCSAGVAASVRRNFGKDRSTTLFFGGGAEVGLGAVGGGGKFGGQITFSDNGSVDGGLRGSVSGTLAKPGKNGYNGAESEFQLTVMGGLKTEHMKVRSTGIGGEE